MNLRLLFTKYSVARKHVEPPMTLTPGVKAATTHPTLPRYGTRMHADVLLAAA